MVHTNHNPPPNPPMNSFSFFANDPPPKTVAVAVRPATSSRPVAGVRPNLALSKAGGPPPTGSTVAPNLHARHTLLQPPTQPPKPAAAAQPPPANTTKGSSSSSHLLLPAFNPNDYKCAVCSEWGEEDEDPILCCRGCDMWVHAHCYGPQYVLPEGERAGAGNIISSSSASSSSSRGRTTTRLEVALNKAKAVRPDGSFLCAVCASGMEADKGCVCQVCLRDVASATPSARAAKPLVSKNPALPPPPPRPSAATKATKWVHISCAMWCAEAWFWDPEGKEHPDLSEVPRERRALACIVCAAEGRGGGGIPIQCHATGCGLPFHFACACERGWETVVEDGDGGDGGVHMKAFCGIHSSSEHLKAVVAAGEDSGCEACGRSDRPGDILLCDTCDRGWHMGCCTPPLSKLPEGAWHCRDCAGLGQVVQQQASGSGSGSGAAAAAASSSSSSSSSAGPAGGGKRTRGVDAQVPNTYFVHSRKVPLSASLPPPPPTLPRGEIGGAGGGDPIQLPWLSAASAFDHAQLTSTYLPILLGLGRPSLLTLSSSGDSGPAALHLATSYAAAVKGMVMVCDFGDPTTAARLGANAGGNAAAVASFVAGGGGGGGAGGGGGGARRSTATSSRAAAAATTSAGGGSGSGGLSGAITGGGGKVRLGAMVILHPSKGSEEAWGCLQGYNIALLVVPLNSPQDTLLLPQFITETRASIHCSLQTLVPSDQVEAAFSDSAPPSKGKSSKGGASSSTSHGGAGGGIKWVLASLTENHKRILRLAVEGREGRPHTMDSLLAVCKRAMVVRSHADLRSHLLELTDHGILGESGGLVRLLVGEKEVMEALDGGR